MVKNAIHGKVLTPKEPEAGHLKCAMEGFADGTFPRMIDCCRYLVKNKVWTKQDPVKYLDKFKEMLLDCVYAGDVEYTAWGVQRRKGVHVGLISYEVYEINKRKLNAESKGKRIRIDTSSDFPLRGLTVCASCERPLTGAWSQGSTKKYAYYFCQNKDCEESRKNIRKDTLENDFNFLLKKQTLKEKSLKPLQSVFDSVWQEEVASLRRDHMQTTERMKELDQKIGELVDLARRSKSDAARGVYEKQIEDAAEERAFLEGAPTLTETTLAVPYRTALEKVTVLLKSPYKVWFSLDVFEQHKLFFFIFDEKLAYSKKTGYRTDNLSCAVRLFEEFSIENSLDVEMAEIESASE